MYFMENITGRLIFSLEYIHRKAVEGSFFTGYSTSQAKGKVDNR